MSHHLTQVGDALPPRYFCPPSPADNPVNRVVAFYPPTGFTGTFERQSVGENWIRTK